jgi:septum formation inhibitor-activating ATPase MinD
MSSSEQLNLLKQNIECLEKPRQIEILRIINESQSTIINENKNGIYINMTSLTEDTLTELKNFIKYIYTQEEDLNTNEKLKKDFLNTYF